MKIGLVTDSTSDIPVDIAHCYGIEVVPAIITVNGESYTDGVQISREDFYARLPELNPPPQTASPSVVAFQNAYEQLLHKGMDAVLSIHPPAQISGLFNTAWLAAGEFGEKVHVLDSGQVSLGMGFQIMLAAEAVLKGIGMENLLHYLAELRKRARIAALLDSIDYVRRSGRVSWALAKISGLLHLQPLLGVQQGAIQKLGQVRTRPQGINRLQEILNSWGPLERLAVLHTNAETAARQLLESVKTRVVVPPLIVNITTVIGTHVGPNGLGFAAVPLS